MNEYSNFTSLQPHEEAQFVVFERNTQENLQKAMMAAIISGIAVGLVGLVLYFGFAPPKKHKKHDDAKSQVQKAPAEAAPAPGK